MIFLPKIVKSIFGNHPILLQLMVEIPVRIDVSSLFDETESLSILARMLKYGWVDLQERKQLSNQ